jgi:hypothetical protein
MERQNHYSRRPRILDTLAIGIHAIAIAVVIIMLTSCTSVPIAPNTSKPQLTLKVSIDGAQFDLGISLGSASPTHTIAIQSNTPVNYFTMQSCHRSVQFNDVIEPKWYQWGQDSRSFAFTYTQAPGIEDKDCPIRFNAFSNTVGKAPVASAVVDFKNARYLLMGENICNGADGVTTGTMLCHSQVGLRQRVHFQTPVQVGPQITDPAGKVPPYSIKDQCQGRFIDPLTWEYDMPDSECYVVFDQIAPPHARAKLTAIPFTDATYGGN